MQQNNQMAMNQQPFGAPSGVGFAPPQQRSSKNSRCPPGLEYLTQVSQLLVKQKIEILEVLIDVETSNKYEVLNSMGQRIYYAAEDSNCLLRQICGPLRSFNLKVLDNMGRQVISVERPLRCMHCCCFCCLQQMDVYAPPGNIIGKIKQLCHPLRPKFSIMDGMGNEVLKVEGPICTCDFCGEIKFSILALDGETEIGRLSKHWSGLLKEFFTDTDNFGITFPIDLDVRVKGTLLALAFMIDFMYYEDAPKND